MKYSHPAAQGSTYGEVEARPEKKNLRGQVTQEARPACVLVEKEAYERIKKAAGYHHAVDCTQTQIDKLNKAMAQNEVMQQLKTQVDKQQNEIDGLNKKLARQGQKLQDREWAIEQYENTLQIYGLGHHIIPDKDRDRDEPEWK